MPTRAASSSLAATLAAIALLGCCHSGQTRDPAQRAAFMKSHPCPANGNNHGACPGYVVDHIQALKRGGADRPENMQWQTIEEGKQKDRWE